MRTYIILLLLFIGLSAFSQRSENLFSLVFYNIENFYDTITTVGGSGNDFTPESQKQWNSERYLKKVDDIGKVLSAIGDNELPEIIGLSEVENKRVLQDLIKSDYLRKGNYEIIHKDGPDARGIDVALLYRKDEFIYSGSEFIHITFPFDSSLTTRDILHVTGKLSDGRDIHLYVNHWTSRVGGQRETESRRMYCAVALRRSIDMVLSRDSRARIVLMGDFNDDPTNKSLMNVIQSTNKRKNISIGEFYNLMYDEHNLSQTGSYLYQGEWYMYDQIIISPNLLTAVEGFRCTYESGKVFRQDWMMVTNNKGVASPKRTYEGNKYSGGISDHLPVYLRLKK